MGKRTLILVRHAHRDTSEGRQWDNGLSRKGLQQCRRLTEYFRKFYSGSKPIVYSSPARRCVETVEEICALEKRICRQSKVFFEQGTQEKNKAFEERVSKFCKQWSKASTKLTLVCSHGDWLPVAIEILTGTRVELGKSGWAKIEMINGKSKLRELIHSFS